MANQQQQQQQRSEEVILSSNEEEEEEEEDATTTVASSFTLIDMIHDMWIVQYSACKNLRTIISYVSKYLTSQSKKKKKSDLDMRRAREGIAMKSVLLKFLGDVGARNDSMTLASSKDDLHRYILEYRNAVIATDGVDPFLSISFTNVTYMEWIGEYRVYIKKVNSETLMRRLSSKTEIGTVEIDDWVPIAAAAAAGAVDAAKSMQQQQIGVNTVAAAAAGIWMEVNNTEEFFDASIFDKGNNGKEQIQQYFTRLEDNGHLRTWRTPGEVGSLLVRLDVYKVKDIFDKDKRNWWKYAKVRSQFLSANSGGGKKLNELLNEAAREMAKVPGITYYDERKQMY